MSPDSVTDIKTRATARFPISRLFMHKCGGHYRESVECEHRKRGRTLRLRDLVKAADEPNVVSKEKQTIRAAMSSNMKHIVNADAGAIKSHEPCRVQP